LAREDSFWVEADSVAAAGAVAIRAVVEGSEDLAAAALGVAALEETGSFVSFSTGSFHALFKKGASDQRPEEKRIV
jgi:hypothetical protein